MRILWKKPKENKIKLVVDTLEDMWHLKQIIGKNDIVYGHGYRRIVEKDRRRKRGGERKRIKVKLKVECVEFHEATDRLRITGTIVSGEPEEFIDFGSHHTLNIELGTDIVIEKEWKDYQLKILKECQRKSPRFIMLSVDRGEAVFGIVKDYGIEYSTLRKNIPGKDEPEKIPEAERSFYSDVAGSLGRYDFQRCIVCGAGFYPESFLRYLKEKNHEVFEKCILEKTGSYGENAISELLKKGIVHQLISESRIGEETILVERLFEEVSKDGRAVYGFRETAAASQIGAVATLLVTYDLLKKKRDEIDGVIKLVEKNKGRVVIISTGHEAGKRLEGLGGIGALTRYKIG